MSEQGVRSKNLKLFLLILGILWPFIIANVKYPIASLSLVSLNKKTSLITKKTVENNDTSISKAFHVFSSGHPALEKALERFDSNQDGEANYIPPKNMAVSPKDACPPFLQIDFQLTASTPIKAVTDAEFWFYHNSHDEVEREFWVVERHVNTPEESPIDICISRIKSKPRTWNQVDIQSLLLHTRKVATRKFFVVCQNCIKDCTFPVGIDDIYIPYMYFAYTTKESFRLIQSFKNRSSYLSGVMDIIQN